MPLHTSTYMPRITILGDHTAIVSMANIPTLSLACNSLLQALPAIAPHDKVKPWNISHTLLGCTMSHCSILNVHDIYNELLPC